MAKGKAQAVQTGAVDTSVWGGATQRVREVSETHAAFEARDRAESSERALKGMSRKERRAFFSRANNGQVRDYAHLLAVKPRQGYVFHSDYFEIDGEVGCILSYFHDESARDELPPFWGVNLIPYLPQNVTAILLEQVSRVTESWLTNKIKESERLDRLDSQEQSENGTKSTRRKASKVSADIEQVIAEIQDGAAYLSVHYRILLKASSLEILDDVIDDLRRKYIDAVGNLSIAGHHGLQRQELATLFSPNASKKGKGFHFTSTELAGAFNLVTNGLNDRGGEFVGYMVGDVNNSGVLMDVDMYKHHVVVADDDKSRAQAMGNAQVADMWASKISQAALINNKRVVHIILDGADLTGVLGPRMETITARIDMSQGDVNPFEVFGERKDQLSLFSTHLEKLVLMTEQAYEPTDADRSIIRASLKDTLTQFYVDQDMWVRNAKHNVDRLRLVGIPHDQVPQLKLFVTYLDQRYKALTGKSNRDDELLHAYSVLSAVFKDMLDANGDLFNVVTKDAIDGAQHARRVIYDFSSLINRGKGVAMAQLVNVLAFAASALGEGDTLIVHGAELIDAGVKPYVTDQFERLYRRNARVALCYNGVKAMLDDSEFNHFDEADWTALGAMSDALVPVYEKKLAKRIPVDMTKVITRRGEGLTFLRRGTVNVVFKRDLALGVNAHVRGTTYDGSVAPGRNRGAVMRKRAGGQK